MKITVPTEEFGYTFARGAIRAVAIVVFWGFLLVWGVNAGIDAFGLRGYDATDDASRKTRSGMRIYHDHGTGCQYLATREGTLTPRLDASGKPMCGTNA